MRYLILLLPLIILAFAACSSDASPTVPDARQATYNQLLASARQNVRDDPELSCEPAFQDLILDQIDAPGGQKALLQLAMTDACKEAGHLSDLAQFSAYYPD
jgi:hypothetical protein